jgi:glycerophosphoryl diester phosphodiesterase
MKFISWFYRYLFLILFSVGIQFTKSVNCEALTLPHQHTSASAPYYMNPRTPEDLRKMFHYTGDSVSFLSSHRGGPEINMPENCIATYANTLMHTWSIMEIDPRYTKDSVLVVHHDPILERTTTGHGKVSDFTLQELQQLQLKDTKGKPTQFRIQTLNEIMKWSKGKTVLILDKKEVPIEDRIRFVEQKNAESFVMIMAYSFEEAKLCYRLNRNIMMEVFISTPDKVKEFDQTGVPWENVVVFVGHKTPDDLSVFRMIHERGALCILGTSRNLDRKITAGTVTDIEELKKEYKALYKLGADILETDVPVPVCKLVSERLSSRNYQLKFLQQ